MGCHNNPLVVAFTDWECTRITSASFYFGVRETVVNHQLQDSLLGLALRHAALEQQIAVGHIRGARSQ